MLENLFLTYANNKFYEKPEYLYKILKEIEPFIESFKGESDPISIIFTQIVSFSKKDDLDELQKEIVQDKFDWPNSFSVTAYNAVHGYGGLLFWTGHPAAGEVLHDKSCVRCSRMVPGIHHNKLLKENGIDHIKQLKCHECMQLQFCHLLKEITKGTLYTKLSEIRPFRFLLYDSYDIIRTIISINNNELKKVDSYIRDDNVCYGPKTSVLGESFQDFLGSLVGYSLLEFLQNNKREKLKLCPYCNKFYIAKDVRQQKCKSDECKKQYESEKKRKQRKKDPVKYY